MNKTPEVLNSTDFCGAPVTDRTHKLVMRSVTGAPTHHNLLGFQRTNYPQWVWKARPNSLTQLKRPKLASQPIQHTRHYAGGTPNCSNL